MKRSVLSVALVSSCLFLSGCAHKPTNPQDPYENFNRAMFALNMDLDHLFLRPVTKVYTTVTPLVLRKGVTNAIDNIGELRNIPNDVLQGKLKLAFNDIGRLIVNSTLGIGGLFDVAARMGLQKNYQTFGLTLAYWSGGKPAPYLVLPVFGPSTFRDGFGLIFDGATDPFMYMRPNYLVYAVAGLNIVNTRSNYMDANKLLDTSFDPYVFVRDIYLQRQNARVANSQKNLPTVVKVGYTAL